MADMSQNVTPEIYSGRVGHDVSEGFCSCGGYHYPEDGIRAGTKTVLALVDGKAKLITWECPMPRVDDDEPDLPDSFGRLEEICADGEHRYLPDAPRCGCGARPNLLVKYERLRAAVVEAVEWWHAEINRTRSTSPIHIALEEFETELFKAASALIAFEAEHKIGEG
jgi:hypothetical protein